MTLRRIRGAWIRIDLVKDSTSGTNLLAKIWLKLCMKENVTPHGTLRESINGARDC